MILPAVRRYSKAKHPLLPAIPHPFSLQIVSWMRLSAAVLVDTTTQRCPADSIDSRSRDSTASLPGTLAAREGVGGGGRGTRAAQVSWHLTATTCQHAMHTCCNMLPELQTVTLRSKGPPDDSALAAPSILCRPANHALSVLSLQAVVNKQGTKHLGEQPT